MIKAFIGDKKFYKTLLVIVIPIVLQQFITQFVSLVDNLMIGQIGNSEMTGVSLGNQLLFVFNLMIFGAISGASIFASQYYGAEDKKGYQQTFKFKWMMGIFFFVVSTLLFVFFSEELLSFFINTNDGDYSDPTIVLGSGKKYLLIMLIGNLPFVIKEIYASSLREMKETFIPMLSGVIAILVNLVFNALLIFGYLGFPELGVAGAAIATVISRFVEMFIIMIYAHVKVKKYPFFVNIYKDGRLKKSSIGRFLPRTIMLVLNETFWALGLTLMLSCYSLRGLDIVSSFNIANTISNVFITVGTSLGNATAIIIGSMLGAKKVEEAKSSCLKIIGFAFMVSLVFAVVEVISSFIVPNIYDTTETIKEMSKIFIIISACLLPINCINTVIYFTIRAGGRMLLTVLFDAVFVMVVRVPIAFILSKYTNLSIYLIYGIATGIDFVKIFLGGYFIKKGVWIRFII